MATAVDGPSGGLHAASDAWRANSGSRSGTFLVEHDLFGKPVGTFRIM
jgi:hypothetical protein